MAGWLAECSANQPSSHLAFSSFRVNAVHDDYSLVLAVTNARVEKRITDVGHQVAEEGEYTYDC